MPSSRTLRLTREAEAGIREILPYTRDVWGDEQRWADAATLDAALDRLTQFPGIGKTRDDLAAGLRSHPVGEHVVDDRLTDDVLIVRRIIHHSRDAAAELSA